VAVIESMGTVVEIDGTPIYGVQDITGPGISREVIDITNHSSPGGARERRATLLDFGEYSFPLVVDTDDAGMQALYAAIIANTSHTFTLTLPDGTEHEFEGKVTNFSMSAPVTEVVTADVTLMPFSAPEITWAAGS
jgi:hypothetical protein